MNRRKLFVDYDGVIVNTISAITSLYNTDFAAYDGFKPIDWHDVKTWEFIELDCATPEYIDTYFNQPRFFDVVEFFPFALLGLEKLNEYYEISVVSSGNPPNLKLKEQWVANVMPYASFIGVDMNKYSDKSHVRMDYVNSVFIDDLSNNLRKSDAALKICFGEIYPWNDDWDGIRCNSWADIVQYLLVGIETNEDKN